MVTPISGCASQCQGQSGWEVGRGSSSHQNPNIRWERTQRAVAPQCLLAPFILPHSRKKRHSTERGQVPATGAGDPGRRLSFTSHSYGDPKQWAAFLGTPFLSGADGQLERVARIHKHPFYNLYTLDYDVALLELVGPVRRSRLVRPICLPEPAPRLPDGARCVITGWGSVREGGRRHKGPRPEPHWGPLW